MTDAVDAARYRLLRELMWHNSNLFVVAGGKDRIKLGTDCPSLERLDSIVDALLALRASQGEVE